MENLEFQEIHCHNCNQYVRFKMDMSLNGNHVLKCPKCGHEHCRVVKDGIITSERWGRRNGPTIQISQSTITYSATSCSTTGSTFLNAAWGNMTSSWSGTTSAT